ncbi:MAG: ATP-binding protein [Limnobacter sp.]|nr:ATP-binding protein [Limnobacter sp.]
MSVALGLRWFVLPASVFEQWPFIEKLSLHTAILSCLTTGFILSQSRSRGQTAYPLIGLIYCALLTFTGLQTWLDMGSASPGTVYSFTILFVTALLSTYTGIKLPKGLYFLLFASVQSVGVIGITQYILDLEDISNKGFFQELSPSTSLILLMMAPLMFVQANFKVLDKQQKYNLAHQNMAVALFALPIGLALLSALPNLLEGIKNSPELLPILLGLSSMLSCWFLFSFGAYAGEKETEVQIQLDLQAKELEELHAQQLTQAEEKVKEQTRFSSLLAHEIRTPLSTVLGLVEVLKLNKTEELKSVGCWNNLQQIESSAKLLREMINSVLDYAKLKAGRLSVLKNACELKPFLEELGTIYEPVAKRKRIEFTLVPVDFEPNTVMMDETRVREIMSNLIDNALKFTPNGGRVQVIAQRTGQAPHQQLVFKVIDNGQGIDPSQKERIFQPFKQASEGISRRYGGTGLGLSYSRELAEFMEGRLEVESQQGQGCTFTLTMPFVKASTEERKQQKPAEEENISMEAVDDHVVKALMVEDHPLNATIHSTLLKEIGVDCDWVESGEKALEKVQTADQYDVILMDINLGEGLSGLETTVELRHRFGTKLPPVLALTAGTMDSELDQIKQCGIKGLIPKPFDLIVAREAIRNAREWHGVV